MQNNKFPKHPMRKDTAVWELHVHLFSLVFQDQGFDMTLYILLWLILR